MSSSTLPADRPIPVEAMTGVGWFEFLRIGDFELGNRVADELHADTERRRVDRVSAELQLAGAEGPEDYYASGALVSCSECSRTFNLELGDEFEEYAYGHDCETT